MVKVARRCSLYVLPVVVILSAFLGGQWIIEDRLHVMSGPLGAAIWPAFCVGLISRRWERATWLALMACVFPTCISLMEASLSPAFRSSYGHDWRQWILIHSVIAAVSLQMWFAGRLWPFKDRLMLLPVDRAGQPS